MLISTLGRTTVGFHESGVHCPVPYIKRHPKLVQQRKGQMLRAIVHLLLAGERTASHKGGGEGVCAAARVSVSGGERKDAAGRARLLPRAGTKGGRPLHLLRRRGLFFTEDELLLLGSTAAGSRYIRQGYQCYLLKSP